MSMAARALYRAIGAGVLLLCFFPAHATCVRPEVLTADGGRYCGPLVNGKLHGRGVMAWSNGAHYDVGAGPLAHRGGGNLRR
jgi:hypothetical protein